ncbi:hypothetical protein H4687_000313 [Streptomyces stelliscabiei]|uniref:Uncharacterized protein n=1 Tax=Streptomyces stelliscabiei TaxID=146820 RepID=A0A8I0TN66_9ACTN|nr:hypothetical protein [Streptomyces stelliscabiei]
MTNHWLNLWPIAPGPRPSAHPTVSGHVKPRVRGLPASVSPGWRKGSPWFGWKSWSLHSRVSGSRPRKLKRAFWERSRATSTRSSTRWPRDWAISSLRFPRDAECVDRGSDGSHERNIDHGRPQKVLAGVA